MIHGFTLDWRGACGIELDDAIAAAWRTALSVRV
jgi:hypothetical protein